MSVESLFLLFAIVVCLITAIAAIVMTTRLAGQTTATADALGVVSKQVTQLGASLQARLDGNAGEMNRTLVSALQQATQALTGSIGTVREETRAKLDEKFVQVTERLGDLKATNERIVEFSRSLDQFQRILQSPKMRGDFGEFTLTQMLADLLPAASYECQARVGSSRVDALVNTPHGALCIDSKFPLDNFRRALEQHDPVQRDAAMKAFLSDVRARADEIAVKYIVPPQTLEFALMFVPAENVYYELLGRPELLEYARKRRVVPVSPNTLYAYFQALAMGFRGLAIQREAKRVEQLLDELRMRFEKFQEHFQKIGRHLDNARTQFADAWHDVERFESALHGLKVGRIEEMGSAETPDQAQLLLDPASTGVAETNR